MISIRVAPGLKRDLSRGAEAEGRSLAAYVTRILSQHVAGLRRRKRRR